MDGQFYQIKIKKECVDIQKDKPPSFHLWAKDRDELKQMLMDKNIDLSDMDSIRERGSDWNKIANSND
tara:strand:- start:1385 stop:1588 length:204 start_codon:yes stop_codon:yes gene_type:complete